MEDRFYNYNRKNTALTIEEESEYQITSEHLKDAVVVNSSLGSKLVMSNYKKDKEHLTRYSTLVRKNFGHYVESTKIIKTYYDTDDMFFHSVGINICETIDKKHKEKEIIVRYDSNVERITYLKFLPDTYYLKVKTGDKISKHLDFIESAILQLITNGLQTNVMNLLKTIKPLIMVNKDREIWNYALPNKLIVNFNFDRCVYSTTKNRDKYKVDILEITAENKPNEFSDVYNNFIKDLIMDLPTLIEAKHSDLFIGLDYLLDIRK